MDVEAEIRDLKRRVGELEGTHGFVTGQLRDVHRAVLGFQEQATERFGEVDDRLDHIDTRLDGFKERFDHVDARLEGLKERLDHVDARLDAMTSSSQKWRAALTASMAG